MTSTGSHPWRTRCAEQNESNHFHQSCNEMLMNEKGRFVAFLDGVGVAFYLDLLFYTPIAM